MIRAIPRNRYPLSSVRIVFPSMNRPLGVSLLVSCMFVPGLQGQDSGTENELPPLVVLCSVDQLATRLLREALPHMGRDGFRRLLREGVGFERCAFAHACTVTGPSSRPRATLRSRWPMPTRPPPSARTST